MLEALLISGGGTLYYESGPGVQLLTKGDLQAGFFGEVSSSELFSTSQLSDQVEYNAGTILEEYPIWLKFAYKGKFLFIPKSPIKNLVSWLALYNAGLVYGTDDTGPFSAQLPTLNTNQLRVATRGRYRFKVRLMRGLPTDPHVTSATTNDSDFLADSEWNRLLYKVSNELTSASVGTKWAEYTARELGVDASPNKFTIVQEHDASFNNIVGRGGTGIRYIPMLAKAVATVNNYWRPVLELLPEDYLLSDKLAGYETDATLRPLSIPELQLSLDARDVLPIGNITWTIPATGEDAPVLANATMTYGTAGMILPIPTPRVLGDQVSTAYPAAKLGGKIVDEGEVLRTTKPFYSTDRLVMGSFKAKGDTKTVPPAQLTWSILDEDLTPPLSSTLTVKNLSGFDAA